MRWHSFSANGTASRQARSKLAAFALTALLAGLGADTHQPRSATTAQLDLEKIAASDPRIEFMARIICKSRGLDPDHNAPPYPGPLWEQFILSARDFLAEDDAAEAWIKRHPGRQGPPDQE